MKVSILSSLFVLGIAAAPRAEAQSFRGEARLGVHVPAPSFRVRVAPPVLRAEARVRAPSPGHVWAPGYWGWNRDHHAYDTGPNHYDNQYDDPDQEVPAQYEYIPVPPSPRHYWVRGDWYGRGASHHWRPGRWEARRYDRYDRDYRHDSRRDDHHGRWARGYSRR
jgi:hypothetical protein